MAILSSMWIKAETLRTLADTVEKKGEKGIELTVGINDEANEWGQNLASYVSQSKEDREAKKTRFYVGNGKVFWTDGSPVLVPTKQENAHTPKKEFASEQEDNLPF